MPTEVEWQHKIIRSCKLQGGHGGKWSSQYQVGKPDIVARLPLAGDFWMEVKLEKGLPKNGEFDRRIDITEKQRYELEQYHKAGGLALIGVVLYWRAGRVDLVLLPWSAERVMSGLLGGPSVRGQFGVGGVIDMENMVRLFKDAVTR